MKKCIFLIITSLFFAPISAQTPSPKDISVELWANVQNSPPSIELNWIPVSGTTKYDIYKGQLTSNNNYTYNVWNPIATNLSASTTQYIDNNVSLGLRYDYIVVRTASVGSVSYQGYGLINSGIQIPEIHSRGKLILLIASTFSTTLATEINRLVADLEGDGWEVLKSYVNPTSPVTTVKAQILNTFQLDTLNTKALFLLGHIPVPYSGNLAPDGHINHLGAWPADVYYADMNGVWTDVSVTSPTASGQPARIQNIPGDGKFDQSQIYDTELEIGRVDLSGMTSFTATEVQLIKNYLDKDHDYRKKNFTPLKQAIVDDNFGYFGGQSFASNGYRNFGPLVNPSNVFAGDYFTSMANASYQWSYGCGGGSYTSAAGIGNTINFANSNLQGVFTMLFGSYFGDWDVNNNFLRAPLCQGKTLTNIWTGRPNSTLHDMAMGNTIGSSVKLSQTSLGYSSPINQLNLGSVGEIHVALMGDPSLRNDIVGPVSNVVATKVGNNCNISWSASTETAIVGYNIYMKNATNTSYIKVNTIPIAGTTYTDNCLIYPGIYKYMVRALKLEITPSGSYYNMSEGIADTANNTSNFVAATSFSIALIGNSVIVTNTSSNTVSYNWNFGNNVTSTLTNPPPVTYTNNGTYIITLTGSNLCYTSTSTNTVVVLSVDIKNSFNDSKMIFIAPNPSSGKIYIYKDDEDLMDVMIYDTKGILVFNQANVSKNDALNISSLSKGLYVMKVHSDSNKIIKKLIIE